MRESLEKHLIPAQPTIFPTSPLHQFPRSHAPLNHYQMLTSNQPGQERKWGSYHLSSAAALDLGIIVFRDLFIIMKLPEQLISRWSSSKKNRGPNQSSSLLPEFLESEVLREECCWKCTRSLNLKLLRPLYCSSSFLVFLKDFRKVFFIFLGTMNPISTGMRIPRDYLKLTKLSSFVFIPEKLESKTDSR